MEVVPRILALIVLLSLASVHAMNGGRQQNQFLMFQEPVYLEQNVGEYLERAGKLSTYMQQKTQEGATNCIGLIVNWGFRAAFQTCKQYVRVAINLCHAHNMPYQCGLLILRVSAEANKCQQPPQSELCALLNLIGSEIFVAQCTVQQLSNRFPLQIPNLDQQLYNSQQQVNQWGQLQQNRLNSPVNVLSKIDLVEVHTIPIGQGDCNIISCNGEKNIIIFDCGSRGGNRYKKKNLHKSFESYFNYAKHLTILISHGDADHFNLLQNILTPGNTNHIQRIIAIVGGIPNDYKNNFKRWLRELTTDKAVVFHKGLKVGYFCGDPNIYFDFIEAEIRIPEKKKNPQKKDKNPQKKDKNQRGMVMKLTCETCQSSLLFSGDMEGKAAKSLAESNLGQEFLRSTHYKIAHHGASSQANKPGWLEAISPVEVHVSHMYNGQYHHPRCQAYQNILDFCPISTESVPHPFTCFTVHKREGIAHHHNIWYRMYSTAPAENVLCHIILVFSENSEARTRFFCQKKTDF